MAGTSQHVAVLSFALEANVFNSEPRRLSDFQCLFGGDYENDERQAGFVRRLRAAEPALFEHIDVHFVCLFRGWCGGLIPAADFAEMKRAAAVGLQALGHVDGVFLDLHGAMGAQGYDDAEAELAEAVRDAAPGVRLVAASFDLHGNFSERLGGALDLVAAYKTMPHMDMEETKTKGLRMLLACLQDATLAPALVVLPIPALLPGECVVTTEMPGQALYSWLRDLEPPTWRVDALEGHLGPPDHAVAHVDGLFDAALFVGHGYADEARVGACVVLSGRADAVPALQQLARGIAQRYWDTRAAFDYPAAVPLLPWDTAVEEMYAALAKGERALVGDYGDNIGGGASGDVPFVTRRLLERARAPPAEGLPGHPRVLICGLADRPAVEACAAAVREGRQTLASLSVGGAHADSAPFGDGCSPLELRDAAVLAIVNEGRWAVVKASTSLTIVLQASNWAFFHEGDVARLTAEFHPSKYDVVIVKGGSTASLVEPMAGSAKEAAHTRCFMAATPGATAHPILPRVHIRAMYPMDAKLEWVAPAGRQPTRYRAAQP